MNILALALIIAAVVVIALLAVKAKSAPREPSAKPDVYYLKKAIFSPAERSFFGVLESLD